MSSWDVQELTDDSLQRRRRSTVTLYLVPCSLVEDRILIGTGCVKFFVSGQGPTWGGTMVPIKMCVDPVPSLVSSGSKSSFDPHPPTSCCLWYNRKELYRHPILSPSTYLNQFPREGPSSVICSSFQVPGPSLGSLRQFLQVPSTCL